MAFFVRVDGCGHAENIQNIFYHLICSEVEKDRLKGLMEVHCGIVFSLWFNWKMELCMERNR